MPAGRIEPAQHRGGWARIGVVGRTIVMIYAWPALVVAGTVFVVDGGGTIADKYQSGGLEVVMPALVRIVWDAGSSAITAGLLWPLGIWRLLS